VAVAGVLLNAIALGGNAVSLHPLLRREVSFMTANADFDATAKMNHQLPYVFDLIQHLRRVSPSRSTILIPSRSSVPRFDSYWGSEDVYRGFLYPRRIVAVPDVDPANAEQLHSEGPIFTVVIPRAEGASAGRWPAGLREGHAVSFACSGWGVALVRP
jgi:hypothetical protein